MICPKAWGVLYYCAMDIAELNRRIRADIPSVAAMCLEVVSADATRVAVRIPADGNGNDKGTLFAGVLYSGLVLAGWCLVMSRARESGFVRPWAAIVDAQVTYAKPLRADAEAVAVFAEAPRLVPGARNWAHVSVSIGAEVAFTGRYAVGDIP